jgi:hypothetical protein
MRVWIDHDEEEEVYYVRHQRWPGYWVSWFDARIYSLEKVRQWCKERGHQIVEKPEKSPC